MTDRDDKCVESTRSPSHLSLIWISVNSQCSIAQKPNESVLVIGVPKSISVVVRCQDFVPSSDQLRLLLVNCRTQAYGQGGKCDDLIWFIIMEGFRVLAMWDDQKNDSDIVWMLFSSCQLSVASCKSTVHGMMKVAELFLDASKWIWGACWCFPVDSKPRNNLRLIYYGIWAWCCNGTTAAAFCCLQAPEERLQGDRAETRTDTWLHNVWTYLAWQKNQFTCVSIKLHCFQLTLQCDQ